MTYFCYPIHHSYENGALVKAIFLSRAPYLTPECGSSKRLAHYSAHPVRLRCFPLLKFDTCIHACDPSDRTECVKCTSEDVVEIDANAHFTSSFTLGIEAVIAEYRSFLVRLPHRSSRSTDSVFVSQSSLSRHDEGIVAVDLSFISSFWRFFFTASFACSVFRLAAALFSACRGPDVRNTRYGLVSRRCAHPSLESNYAWASPGMGLHTHVYQHTGRLEARWKASRLDSFSGLQSSFESLSSFIG
ncbi:unnamed protein product [Protopolystoma xenopodis]|uniref:Uncharacterized protein n=1 Tax=Protopolystoma xenopodis TaxID=117903 RepID=A0A3S5FDM5_9PLAT|nr:unnamed protein product [Protopolystoma xenopodis]